jgi:hypothetical protein
MHTEAHPVKRLQSGVVEMNTYSQVAENPDVGRHFLEFAYPLWI